MGLRILWAPFLEGDYKILSLISTAEVAAVDVTEPVNGTTVPLPTTDLASSYYIRSLVTPIKPNPPKDGKPRVLASSEKPKTTLR